MAKPDTQLKPKRINFTRELHKVLKRPHTTFCFWDIWILNFCWGKHKWLLIKKIPIEFVIHSVWIFFQIFYFVAGFVYQESLYQTLVIIFFYCQFVLYFNLKTKAKDETYFSKTSALRSQVLRNYRKLKISLTQEQVTPFSHIFMKD